MSEKNCEDSGASISDKDIYAPKNDKCETQEENTHDYMKDGI